ncbi:tryptophanyl-tRNA synthetase [Parelusimicrobium proximum]|uniref:tryptophan--tRNA ligase n=1 Tax=Parelusimicrobium proximum TaxID=3228953 RepID=UPI003D16E62B
MSKEIMVSGMRPTGRLHLGNYHGALKNWVELQDKYNSLFFVADLHALTTAYDRTENIVDNSRNMVIDWLTAGLSPEKCTIFIQSKVHEVSELNLLLGMITPLGWLLRNPTYKEQLMEVFKKKYAGQEDIRISEEKSVHKDETGVVTASRKVTLAGKMGELDEDELSELSSFGFLGYPVLMGTDILIHKAAAVPVGQDQVPHLEITRHLARKFNEIYGSDVLLEPRALLTKTSKVIGLDGRKMSKSYGNTIDLGEDLDSVRKKIMSMYTDPNKKRLTDPGDPDGCVVFAFHKIYNPDYEKRCEECKAGALGCVACKKNLFEFMEPELREFNERRSVYAADPARIDDILNAGNKRASDSASAVLTDVKRVMRLLK